MDPQTKSHLLALPPELRNRIYEHVFVSEPEVWLLKAEEPEKDLLLACKQIHSEAAKMYTKAYREYWTETVFTVNQDDPEGITWLDWIEESDLERITRINITTKHKTMTATPDIPLVFNLTSNQVQRATNDLWTRLKPWLTQQDLNSLNPKTSEFYADFEKTRVDARNDNTMRWVSHTKELIEIASNMMPCEKWDDELSDMVEELTPKQPWFVSYVRSDLRAILEFCLKLQRE